MSSTTLALTALRNRFVHELVVALLHQQMHAGAGDLLASACREVITCLEEMFARGTASPFRLTLDGKRISHDGREMLAASLQARGLLDLCHQRNIVELAFHDHLAADELGRFLAALTDVGQRPAFRQGRSSADRLLACRGIRNIQVAIAHGHTADSADDDIDPARKQLGEYQELTSFLHDNHVAAYHGDELEVDRAQGVVEQAISHMGEEPSSLLALASYDDIDSFTVGHSVRVALLALQVARAAGAAKGDLVTIGTAALLHDIGKSRVPQEILLKRGRLDDDEWRLMALHPRLGAEILVEQSNLDPRAIGAAFCHHMSPNGGGYPKPVIPFEPSAVSKLVRVCDVFEALTAVRPYKRALTPVQAYTIMFRNQQDFDQRWLRLFARTIGIYPLGTRVLLGDGTEARVVAHGSDPRQPRLRLLAAPAGGEAPPTETGEPEVEAGQRLGDGTVEIAAVFGAGADREQVLETLRTMQCGPFCVESTHDH